MTIKKINLAITLFLGTYTLNAQIIRTSIVEHFTNTSCSVCAANNDNVYNAVNNHSNALHVSFHPSSPYASDFFNQQNKQENDERTNFYGVYGSTPRIVLNGTPILFNSLNSGLSASASTPTNFKLKVLQNQVSFNNFEVQVVLTKIASDPLSSATLFVCAIEDTIYQTTNNGEDVHYNVFRKALTSTSGNSIQLPNNINDSLVLNFNYSSLTSWKQNRMHTIAILQQNNKELINSALSVNENTAPTNINNNLKENKAILFYPNPTGSGFLYANQNIDLLTFYDQVGNIIKQIRNIQIDKPININDLSSGIYIVTSVCNNVTKTEKIIIQ